MQYLENKNKNLRMRVMPWEWLCNEPNGTFTYVVLKLRLSNAFWVTLALIFILSNIID